MFFEHSFPKQMNNIINLLKTCKSQAQIHQIQAQLITHPHHLHLHPTIAYHFITTCHSLSLFTIPYSFYTHILHLKPQIFICNTLIKTVKNPFTALSFYTHMICHNITPNNYTFPIVLKAVNDVKDLNLAQMVHTQIVKLGHCDDIYVGNALMSVYARNGEMGFFRQVFDEMPQRDVVSWTVMVTGFRQCSRFGDALLTFEQMQYAGVVPNRVTMVNVLATCASCGAIEMGVWIHEFIKRNSWELDVILGTSLVDMYGKCGRIHDALSVFVSMNDKNGFTWNSLIKGLAIGKHVDEALCWFSRMEQEKDINPDEVTLIVILSSCAHFGLLQIGRQIFSSLVSGKYGFLPNTKHYSCFVDLLARSGSLKEAMEVINEMPFEPSKSVWGAFLAGCRSHGDLELTELAAWKLINLDPNNRICYDTLCSLYTDLGKWSELERVHVLMNVRGIKNDLRVSSLEAKYMISY